MLKEYVDYIISDNDVINNYYKHLYSSFNPDITGFTLVFVLPPDLSGLAANSSFQSMVSANNNLSVDELAYFVSHDATSKLLTYAAAEHTPPQTQVTHAQISPRTGGVPYATDVSNSENCSITFVDNINCTIYLYHLAWVEYIRAISNGGFYNNGSWEPLAPGGKYLDPSQVNFGTLDYATSIYAVKYKPDMKTITYIGKSIGCIPSALPSKELIGVRTTNDLALLPFDYTVGAYREYVGLHDTNAWLYSELEELIQQSI